MGCFGFLGGFGFFIRATVESYDAGKETDDMDVESGYLVSIGGGDVGN